MFSTRACDIEREAIRASAGHGKIRGAQFHDGLSVCAATRVEIDFCVECPDFDALQYHAAPLRIEFQQQAARRAAQRTLGT